MIESRRRVVITGGPHAGKSTLIAALSARGFATAPEAALIVIRELNETLGVEGQVAFRRRNPSAFQSRVSETQLSIEARFRDADRDVFFDRGLLDGLAYCRMRNVAIPPLIAADALRGRYSHVVVLETVTPFSARTETGRTSDEATAREAGRLIAQTYSEFGYDPVMVGQMSLDSRVGRILKAIGVAADG